MNRQNFCVIFLPWIEVEKEWEFQHDSAITCVVLFTPESCQAPAVVREGGSEAADSQFNLVVTSAMEISVVYRYCIRKSLLCILFHLTATSTLKT